MESDAPNLLHKALVYVLKKFVEFVDDKAHHAVISLDSLESPRSGSRLLNLKDIFIALKLLDVGKYTNAQDEIFEAFPIKLFQSVAKFIPLN